MLLVGEPAAPPASSAGDAAPLVIIGSGCAAYTLAQEFRRIDGASPLLLLTRDGGEYYSKPSLSNALAQGLAPTQLQTRSAAQMAEALRAEIRTACEVVRIDAATRTLTTADGTRLSFGRLVIAWGGAPLRLEAKGDGADAVQSVNDLDGYRRFHASLSGAGSVAIVGNGLIGCEFANDLASHAYRVMLVGRSAWPLDRLLPPAAGQYLAAALQASGVEPIAGVGVDAVWKDGAAYRLELSDGRRLHADRILSAIGLRPRTAIAEDAGIVCRRGIVTNRRLETSIDGIYALGDCAEVDGVNLPFIAPILHQARALARTLSGEPTSVSYPAMPVVVKTPACPVTVCPPPAGAGGEWICEASDSGMTAVCRDAQGRLLGFALLGSAATQSASLAEGLPGPFGPEGGG
nr:FAD-dependent oxidoreductase [Propionivibrio dicarboxylicus]